MLKKAKKIRKNIHANILFSAFFLVPFFKLFFLISFPSNITNTPPNIKGCS